MRSTIAALLALGAIASPLAAQSGGTSAATRAESVYVDIQNERPVPITVYLKSGRFDRRLVEVPARTTRMLTLPSWAVSGRNDVALLVHAEGQSDLGFRTFIVRSGDRLSLQIPATGMLPSTPDDTMTAPLTPEELESTTITVDNPHDRAVTVYAEQGMYDVRLGIVPPRERATLRFPKSVVGRDRAVRIFVHPEGGTDLSSSLLRIRKGEHLGLKVPKY